MAGIWQARQSRSIPPGLTLVMKTTTISCRRQLPVVSRITRANRNTPKTLQIRRILIPIDFSDASLQAIDHALALSRQFDSELDLVHVCEPVHPISSLSGLPLFVSDAEVERRVRQHLQAVAGSYHLLLPNENVHVTKGRPFEQICELVTNSGADLVVIPTRGNTGLKHLLLGSTSERVVRHASCPVLVIKPEARPKRSRNRPVSIEWSVRRIVVPIDFSDCSFKGLAYAKKLATQFGSTLVLLHCLPPQYYLANEEYSRYDLPLLLSKLEKSARAQLRKLAEEVRRDGIKVETTLEIGHPGQQICYRAQNDRADLIVTATHGNTGLKHVFLGSTAEYVVRHSNCSVLVVPTRERPTLN